MNSNHCIKLVINIHSQFMMHGQKNIKKCPHVQDLNETYHFYPQNGGTKNL